MKGYCIRYALTQGIYEVEVERSETRPERVNVKAGGWQSLRIGTDFFESRDEAIEAAREVARKAGARLYRQQLQMVELAANPKWRTK